MTKVDTFSHPCARRMAGRIAGFLVGALLAWPLFAIPPAPRPRGGGPVDVSPPATGSEGTMDEKNLGSTLADFDVFLQEGRFSAAADLAARLRAAALQQGDEAKATQALIREVQARIGLGATETALRLIVGAEPPKGDKERLLIDLFRGAALSRYFEAYSWEIQQREAVQSADPLDVSQWTREQLGSAILSSYAAAWEQRALWGTESVTPLSGLLEQNDYPARIRGTLRDTLSYLFAESLADSSHFTPRESNELYLLDLSALLAPVAAGPIAAAGAVVEEGMHPLERFRLVLADLEAWHLEAERPEAALEARLTLLAGLRDHLSAAADREQLEQELERVIAAFSRGLEWRAKAQAQLAGWQRDGAAPDALLRAHETASAGALAFPNSLGGRQCRALLDQIEMPSLNLESMRSDLPQRPSILITHNNLPRLYFRAYRLPVKTEEAPEGGIGRDARGVAQLLERSKPVAEWQVKLEDRGDYRPHSTQVVPPLSELGSYVILASQREDFAPINNRAQAVELQLSELVVLGRGNFTKLDTEVELRSGRHGEPVVGAQVELLQARGGQRSMTLASQTTDAEGRTSFSLEKVDTGVRLFLRAGNADDSLFTGEWIYRPYIAPPSRQIVRNTLLFTDRSIYRPGQKIFFKAISFLKDPDSGKRHVEADTPVAVELYDTNNELVARQELRTNRHGSAAGEILIPSGKLLGSWSLRAANASGVNVQVEEYKRPTFEVELLDPESPLRLNQEAVVAGSARYYFGMPLRQGEVSWRVTRRPQYPRWWCWWTPIQEVQNVAAGQSQLDPEGRFEVRFLPKADERLASTPEGRQISYSYQVEAELTDEGGETRSADRSFRAGFVAIDAQLSAAAGFFEQGKKVEVTVRRFDLEGKGRPGKGTWHLFALEGGKALLPTELPISLPPGAEQFALEGDRHPPRHNAHYDQAAALRLLPDGQELASGELESSQQGEASLVLDPASLPGKLPAGLYRLRYRTEDEYGGEVERSLEILVGGEKMARPGLALLLESASSEVKVGEELRLLAGSGLAEVPTLLEIYRGDERVLRRLLQPGEILEQRYRVQEADRGKLLVDLVAVADYQVLALRREIEVPRDDLRLELAFSTFRDRLRPGQKERFTLEVKSADGTSLDSSLVEILAYMYDRSLDLYGPHNPVNPLDLIAGRPGVQPFQSSVRGAWAFWRIDRNPGLSEYPSLRSDRLTFFDNVQMGGPGYGGRGGGPMMRSMVMMSSPPPPAPEMAAAAMEDTGVVQTQSLMLGDVASAPAEAEPEPEMRENFAETAFFEPHLQPGQDGSVSFEFTVPDSVTEWNVWAHALADDFRYGKTTRQTRTVKEMLVRPYLPRFLREGDQAELRVSVDNTGSSGKLVGQLDFALSDEASGESLLMAFGLEPAKATNLPFEVEPGQSAILRFPLRVPARLGPVVLRVSGRTADFSDGEQRLLPILPSRLHLAQSRFAVLEGKETRRLTFEDLRRNDDKTRIDEQMVVTLDGQLFTSVLRALPYLVDYPYRCTEQNLNRFVPTALLTSLFDRYPAIARLAKELASRDTPLEPFVADDPNRSMMLEETPWLGQSRGGEVAPNAELAKVLDPAIAKAVREGALGELRQAQDPSGGFPWWPGGKPSPFLTLYLLQGFAQAMEFGGEVPRDMIERAWTYLRQEHGEEIEKLKDPKAMRESFYEITWLNYVLSIYPDLSWTAGTFSEDDRRQMLEASMLHWKELPPRVRLYLAITAQRAGREKDAKLLLESVMDSAKTAPDQGTFWQPEERAWLFYWDHIETHALALRALSEIAPKDPRRQGLVVWLMLNKKLNQWSSTRATAEVIYSLVGYLESEGQLGIREEASVELGGQIEHVIFDPAKDEGRRQMRLAGENMVPERDAVVEVSKKTPGLLFASATWQFSTEKLPTEARGDFFEVERHFFRRSFENGQWQLAPLAEGSQIAVGDEIEVQLDIKAKHEAEFVHLRDPRGAGFEPIDLASGWNWDLGISHYREIRDSATNFFFETLPPGAMKLKYRLRAATAGTFRVGPATLQSMYAPEFAAYSAGNELEVEP